MFGADKYILDADGNYMIFSNEIRHSTAQCASRRHCRFDCVGAGFISLHGGMVSCWGFSESLGIRSRGEEDAILIGKALNLSIRPKTVTG